VLFGCFYINETKHTVYVANIYPNYNDWVVINDFAVDDFTIKTFNVGTLNVNSAAGVNIITSSSISLYGASIAVGGDSVSVSATSPGSVVNIDAASTLDILGGFATFSSQDGDVRLQALTDFELISTGDLTGDYSGSFDIQGVILDFQASKGGSHFLTHSSFISQATTTYADAGNLIFFNATAEFLVEANLAIDIFTGEFLADVESFSLTARRNNILLQTGTILDVGGNTVDIEALDLFTITSLESQVLVSSGDTVGLFADNQATIYSDSEVTFSASEYLEIYGGNNAIFYANEGVAFQSTGPTTFTMISNVFTATGQSVVTQTTDGDISFFGSSFTSNTFGKESIYADRDLYFLSFGALSVQAAASIDLNADRGTLSIADSATTPTVAPITFTTTFNTVLSGTSVLLTPDFINIVAVNNFRIATNEEDRDSEINFEINNAFSSNTNLFLATGGEVEIDASSLVLNAVSADVTFTAVGFPSSYISFDTFNQTETATGDINYNGGQYVVLAEDGIFFTANQYFDLNTDDRLIFDSQHDVNFNVASNMTIDTVLDAQYFTSGDIDIGVSILQQFQIDAGYVQVISSGGIKSSAVQNITAVGTNINFDADNTLSITDTTFTTAAVRFGIVSGDQTYNYDNVEFVSTNTLLQSPPDQDFTFTTTDFSVVGNTNFIGRTLSVNGTDFKFNVGSTFTLESNEEDPIHLTANDEIYMSSFNMITTTDQDLFLLSSSDMDFHGNAQFQIEVHHDLTHTVTGTLTDTTNYFQSNSDVYSEYSVGTTLVSAGTQFSTNSENLDFLSRWGGITVIAQTATFTGDTGTSHVEFDASSNTLTGGFFNLLSTNFQVLGNLNVTAGKEIRYNAADDLVFFGSEFDITSFGSLTLSTPQVLTVESAVITVISDANLKVTTTAGVNLLAGLDKDLTFSQDSSAGTFTIGAKHFLLRSNNDLEIFSSSYVHTANGVDSFGNSILLQSSAMSAGITNTGSSFSAIATDNILFVVDDITNRGGDDINLSTKLATFTVTSKSTGAPVNPIHNIKDSLDAGIFFYASGSEYDPILGYNVGLLYRTEGIKGSNQGVIHVNPAQNLYFNSESYNEILSHNSAVSFSAKSATASYYVGGDLGIESDRSSAQFQSGLTTAISVGQTAQIQSTSTTHSTSHTGTFLSAAGAFEAVADRGGVYFDLVGSSNEMRTTGKSINLEGGADGLFQYTSDTYTATNIDLYAFSTATFIGNSETVTALHNIYYESSINNDIEVSSSISTTVKATAGNIDLNAGLDNSFTAATDSTFLATQDVTFFSSGSFQYIAEATLNILSVENQIYIGRQHAYFESLGTVNVGNGVTNTPIVTIYAGGDTLRSGVELTATTDFNFASAVDNNIVGRDFYSTTEFTSAIVAGGTITLQSTGTDNIGKDVFFKAAESLDFFSEQNLVLTAKTLKFEYDNLDFSTSSDFLLTAVKGISVAGSSFSTDSLTHTLNSKTGITLTANSDVDFSAGTSFSLVAKTTATYSSLQQTEFYTGETMVITSTGTNSPIGFDAKGERSFLDIDAADDTTISSGDTIDYTAEHGFLALTNGDLTFTIGDSFTSTNGGDITISGGGTVTFTASDPNSAGSQMAFTSDGSMSGEIGTSFLMTVSRDLHIEPDVDLTFRGGSIDNNVHDNIFSFVIDNQINLATGRNFNFDINRGLFSGATYDTVALGVNPETGDGVRLSTTGQYSDIEVSAGAGSILTSAIGNILLNSDNAVTLQSSGTVQLLSKGSDGISFNTVDVPTPIVAISRNGLSLVGEDLVTLQSYGFDTASGYIDLRATGYANLGEYNPVVNGTFGIGFFAKESNIDVIVDDATFRMDELRHFIASPNVNGTLLIQANGQSVEGVGIDIESTIITVMAELDVAFEAANIHFFDYGISLYNYEYGTIFPTNANLNRPTIASEKDQTYVAYGHNDKGNAIEFISSVPNAAMLFETGYINLYSGGSVLIEGEIGSYFASEVETYITSASSVILQGDGLNADIGLYLTTRDYFADNVYPPAPVFLGSNIEFHADYDTYIESAGRIISEAQQNIYFVTGPTGKIEITFDEGALFESPIGDLHVTTSSSLSLYSNSDITFEADTWTASFGGAVSVRAAGLADGSGNLIFGDPSMALNANVRNIDISGANVNFFSNYVDITNTNQLEIIHYTSTAAAPACNANNIGNVFMYSPPGAPYDYICSCIGSFVGWNTFPSNTPDIERVCWVFQDHLTY